MENSLDNLLDKIGFAGPLILLAINIIVLWTRQLYLYGFIVFLFINTFINHILKLTIRESRPKGFNDHADGGHYTSGVHLYGMPSAHSQTSFFIISYLWFVTKSVKWGLLGLFLCFLTLYQRWKYKKHTIEQLSVGAVVGILVAYIAFIVSTKLIYEKDNKWLL
jgi:membrane-associated phospholipid phosphatase